MEEGGLYPHPSPFSTNVYWREEMALGPGPPQKKKDRQQRARGEGVNQGSSRDLVTGDSMDTGASSADTVVARISLQGVTELEQERRSEEGWNRRRYQREDEFLWGFDRDSEDGRPFGNQYCTVRNPEVNDLHPPVVSTQPTHRSETRWMVQPPPSAKVMEGKERANRSRSGSGGSNGSSKRAEMGLGRQIGERIVEEKRRKGKMPESTIGSAVISRASMSDSTFSGASTPGQQHERDHPPPARISTDTTSSATSSARANPSSFSISTNELPPRVPTAAPARPHLQTIISSTAISPVASNPHFPISTTFPDPKALLHPRPPLLQTSSNSSLRALQELVSPSIALNARPVSATEKVKLPPPDDKEDQELEIPEVESFWPPDQGGLRSHGAGMGGNRRERWSCDI